MKNINIKIKANEIVKMLIDSGLTHEQMLDCIRLARFKINEHHKMKNTLSNQW